VAVEARDLSEVTGIGRIPYDEVLVGATGDQPSFAGGDERLRRVLVSAERRLLNEVGGIGDVP